MDAHLDPGPSPTVTPQLLSSKFLRKTKFRKEESSNERVGALTGKTLPNSGVMKLKEKQESTTSVGAARDSPVTDSAHLASDSPPEGAEAAQVLKEITVEPNDLGISLPEGATSIISDTGTSHATDSLAQNNAVLSNSSVSRISTSPTQVELALTASSQPLFTMSPEELDRAKTLVLDLLGWGVDPEYLIESGISAAVIFRVFTDLNLRLPKNLVISDKLIDAAYSWGPRPLEFTQNT